MCARENIDELMKKKFGWLRAFRKSEKLLKAQEKESKKADKEAKSAGPKKNAKEDHESVVHGWKLKLKKRTSKEGKADTFDMQAPGTARPVDVEREPAEVLVLDVEGALQHGVVSDEPAVLEVDAELGRLPAAHGCPNRHADDNCHLDRLAREGRRVVAAQHGAQEPLLGRLDGGA
ncbi:hypothetical protein EMIHUDRAFT_208398 [Emiliania huxleyi CCMP1516]|uniref:Uncharacterized protein n=2 Tax=Emiliania huxleyi TaxID=2903 RepID=A0A0D3JAH5_EMIH1|nr:hypothetical protein EMIHUDRAFT_208398 [Emiliania huxleyi CCMP1516]EOD20510.1 hypothetical protein EMIHUDRAFT_208398 [Emiliania huxleyi CCMP1516]|eukprot:XP_005772939.1 hypothetical protein EMIHUDRAFT_208398 [Emiliania huxleyi CCMP1516]